MKILIAGSTGAIGQPLIKKLREEKHQIYGITSSEKNADRLIELGAEPMLVDILNAPRVEEFVSLIRPDVIIDMLTRLPKEYTPEAMKQAAPLDTQIRWEGGGNLLRAAAKNNVKRYISQSCGFWYEPGKGPADEKVPFAANATPGIAAGVKLYAALEKRLTDTKGLECVPLRFGFYYGPGTWFNPGGNMAEQVEKQEYFIIGKGEGVWNFIHIEDAAGAIVNALKVRPGPYNIVNDHPAQLSAWLPAFAKYVKAKTPPQISEEEGLKKIGIDSVYYATQLRAASNAKAKKEWGFQPRAFEWFTKT